MKRWAIAIALLILAVILFTPDARATSVDAVDAPSLVTALASSADTIMCAGANFGDVVVSRPVVLLPYWQPEGRLHIPTANTLILDQTSGATFVKGFRVIGQATIVTRGNPRLTIESCRFDAGLVQDAPVQEPPSDGTVAIRYCTILGDLFVNDYGVDVAMNTVIGATVTAVSRGFSAFVQNNIVQGAPGPGVVTGQGHPLEHSVHVENNLIRNCGAGVVTNSFGDVYFNVITDCAGDGLLAKDRIDAVGNRIERSGGYGIRREGNGYGYTSLQRNVVIEAALAGISVIGPGTAVRAEFNTVVRSRGAGIVVPNETDPDYSPPHLIGNAVAFNGGAGISGGGPRADLYCNGLWMNGIDARSPNNVYGDPQFCDLSTGDLRVSASGPFADCGGGPIGALGASCPARGSLAAAPDGDSDVGMAPFGVQVRGRVALVTLAGPEPASLELLDVAGRRIWRENIVRSGEIVLQQPAGVYFMRLQQGEQTSTSRAVVLR